jgi:hypothetical protein
MKEKDFNFLPKDELEKKLNESIQKFIQIIIEFGPPIDMHFDCDNKVRFQESPAMFLWNIRCFAIIPEHKAIIDEVFPQFYGIIHGGHCDESIITLYWNVLE